MGGVVYQMPLELNSKLLCAVWQFSGQDQAFIRPMLAQSYL